MSSSRLSVDNVPQIRGRGRWELGRSRSFVFTIAPGTANRRSEHPQQGVGIVLAGRPVLEKCS